MEDHAPEEPKANKTRRICLRVTEAEQRVIARSASDQNLGISEFIVSRCLEDTTSVASISRAEWRQVAITCEAWGMSLMIAIILAQNADSHSKELLEELVANNGRNQSLLETILDSIRTRLDKSERESGTRAGNAHTGGESP
jgi:uncharacterized protein (DUF1778 family)